MEASETTMKCPICEKIVSRVTESDRSCQSECQNEYYCHSGDKLIKFINPKGAWEIDNATKNTEPLPD